MSKSLDQEAAASQKPPEHAPHDLGRLSEQLQRVQLDLERLDRTVQESASSVLPLPASPPEGRRPGAAWVVTAFCLGAAAGAVGIGLGVERVLDAMHRALNTVSRNTGPQRSEAVEVPEPEPEVVPPEPQRAAERTEPPASTPPDPSETVSALPNSAEAPLEPQRTLFDPSAGRSPSSKHLHPVDGQFKI